jgi:homoserine dehydrogenase
MGWRASEDAIDVTRLLGGEDQTATVQSIDEWLAVAKPDVVFETTSLNPESGQPAIEYIRKSLQAGAHTITANKAPIDYA